MSPVFIEELTKRDPEIKITKAFYSRFRFHFEIVYFPGAINKTLNDIHREVISEAQNKTWRKRKN